MDKSIRVPGGGRRLPSPEWPPHSPRWTNSPPGRSCSCPHSFYLGVADQGIRNYLHLEASSEYIRGVDRVYEAVQRWLEIQPDPFGFEEDNRLVCPTYTYQWDPAKRAHVSCPVSLIHGKNGLVLKGTARMEESFLKEALIKNIQCLEYQVGLRGRDSHLNWRISIERIRLDSFHLDPIGEEDSE